MTSDHKEQVDAALEAFNAWIELPMTAEEDAWNEASRGLMNFTAGWLAGIADAETRALYDHPQPPAASSAISPSSRWPFEQPHVARDLLVRLYAMRDKVVRDPKLEAEIDVFLAATRRP